MMTEPIWKQTYCGMEVGSFRVVKLIGQGGMGIVFLAEHKNVELRTAIKFLRDPKADQAAVARFVREAKVLSRLDHPSLVRLHDCGALPDGTLYLQMEYLGGQPLSDYVQAQGGMLPLAKVLLFGRQLASALACVHQEQIVHRDLKPSNLYVVPDREVPDGQRVKILDFGIAKLLSSVNSHLGMASVGPTETGQLFGTPRYMSPEQCEGTSELDDRSDVYSLGLILFELLTGKSPYPEPRDLTGWLYAHVQKRACGLQQATNGYVPKALDTLLEQMLSKLAVQRPRMTEVESQLSALLAGAAPLAMVPAPGRRTSLVLAAAVIALLGIVSLVMRTERLSSLFSWLRAKLERQPTDRWISLSRLQSQAPSGMVVIPAGRFAMGSTELEIEEAFQDCQNSRKDCVREEYERERPQHVVSVSDFYLDQYEVTNAEYAAFLNRPLRPTYVEGDRLVKLDGVLLLDLYPKASGITYQDGIFSAHLTAKRKPVVQVTWHGAQEYCKEKGKRLPTEAEWELAARSGERQSPYPWTGWSRSTWPWGNEPARCDGVIANRAMNKSCHGLPISTNMLLIAGPEDVGTALQDRTPQGVYDLAGNVREWVADEFRIPYADCGACLNPIVGTTEASGPKLRVVRGGNFQQERTATRSAGRSRWRETYIATGIGFRCAANP